MNIIITLIFISVWILSTSANVTLEDCTASPFSITPSPTTAPAVSKFKGIWYGFDLSKAAWVPEARCVACKIYEKPAGTWKMQCIILVNKLEDGAIKKYFKYITGTLTLSGTVYTFAAAPRNPTFVVTAFTDCNSEMTVTLCQLINIAGMSLTFTYAIELSRKGAVTANANEIEHKDTCLDVVFDPTKEDGQEEVPACCTTLVRPNSNLPVTDCTQEGWTKVTSGPTTRYYKVMPLKKTWADAKTICQDCYGGKLAKVEDATFLAGVKALLTDADCKDAWIGLSQSTVAAEANKYTWCADSTTFTVTAATGALSAGTNHWSKTPPADDKSNYDSDGTTITADANYCFSVDANAATFGWKECPCTDEKPFVCQKSTCAALTLTTCP